MVSTSYSFFMSAKISKIETYLVDLPTIRPHKLSMTTMRKQSLVIIRLYCSDGIEGVGESTTIGGMSYGDESPEGIKLTIDKYIAPAIIGESAQNINAAMDKVNKQVKGNNFAKSGVETAMMDAQGKRLGVNVATLLGGSVSTSLPVLWTLASGNTETDIAEAERLLSEKRHSAFKLKIGSDEPEKDIKHVCAIKRALGSRAKITVDINQAWSESTAKTGIAAFETEGIDLIEQPIAKFNKHGLARLTERFKIPIMADEAVATPEDAFELARIAASDVFALKIAKAGGLYNVLKVGHIGEAAGVALYGGTMLEGTIGTIASAHAFSTFINLEWGTELFGPLLLTDDFVVNKLVYHNGRLEIPQTPGLGVEVDWEKLKHFQRSNA